jgi:hypothetical protein
MINTLKKYHSKIAAFCLAFLLTFTFVVITHAQESSSSAAAKYGISFPVTELGGCNNLAECKSYCADPEHQTECLDFAKKKGFYKAPQPKQTFVEAAKLELGCETEAACKELCSQQENWQKCSEFAKKHKLNKGDSENLNKVDTLQKAKEILNCTSVEECKVICSSEENKQKCQEFAKIANLKGGSKKPITASRSGKLVPEMTPEQYCRIYPEKCKLSPAPKPIDSSSSAVQGLTTEENLLTKFLLWLGL